MFALLLRHSYIEQNRNQSKPPRKEKKEKKEKREKKAKYSYFGPLIRPEGGLLAVAVLGSVLHNVGSMITFQFLRDIFVDAKALHRKEEAEVRRRLETNIICVVCVATGEREWLVRGSFRGGFCGGWGCLGVVWGGLRAVFRDGSRSGLGWFKGWLGMV